jgi:NitT/TauT family transport system substrate-binding protein
MTALESGSVSCHLTSSPYIFMELENDTLTELPEVNNTWTDKDSFIVGVASEELKDGDPELYQALCDGISRGIDLINSDPETAASLIYELDGNTLEDELAYMKLGNYSVETSGIFEIATFMAENGFLEVAPASYEDLVFENVKGD